MAGPFEITTSSYL